MHKTLSGLPFGYAQDEGELRQELEFGKEI